MSEVLGVNNADVVVAFSPHDELVAKIDFTIERAQRALLAQQHSEGYWQAARGARGDERRVQTPFADLEAATDPTCADLTGRVLEMMGAVGYHADHPVARRAIT